jgi:hypothetical protein
VRTARVLVIDEDPKDAVPLLTALGQLGIGAVYISGDDVKRLPAKPIEGIRYVFLDLNLNGQTESKNYVPYAVEVLKRSVQCIPRVTGIICWTKHKEEVTFLQSLLEKEGIKPAFLKVFDSKLAASADEKAVAEVVTELRSKMEENAARGILAEWEETVHEAATDSATALMQMSADDAELLKLLATIAQASSDEQKLADAHQSTAALHAGLSAVHADSIQLRVEMNQTKTPADEELFKAMPEIRKAPLGLDQRAKLNGILLTTPGNILRPGNVYCCRTCKIAGFSDDKSIRRCINDLFFSNRSRDDEAWWKAFTDGVFKSAIPICLEITPACDHAASKRSFARLIGGLLVGMSSVPNAEDDLRLPHGSRMFAKESEPLLLPADVQNIKGPLKVFVSARLLMSEPVESIQKASALFRLRHPVIADFQAWFASHASRPGYVAIH